VGAATADRRQKPLALHELKHVTFCISIVGPLTPAQNMSDLAPSRMGLLVRNGSRAGMLLPGEAKTAAWQIAECKRKAGLPPDAPVQMYVFPTVTLEEKAKRR
ncbi:MAG: AMMECR1 domain-containing protein, partial [Gemmatimonadales bacterium]|nr:AMMECR1 domain-containing protein [Gemmatimonadales bacterium]